MNRSIVISSAFHVILIFLTAMSLPFLSKKPINLPPIVSVELIQITEKTNIPFAQKAKKTDKPHNIGAILFFLPGYGVTLKNIEEATKAARERALHLNKLKEKKGC